MRGPVALAAAALVALTIVDASAWASTVVTTITGGTSAGAPGFAGDGGPAIAAQLNAPAGVVVDEAGDVVVADTANQRIRRIDAVTGSITTIAGGAAGGAPGFGGDGGPATSAQLNNPAGVAVDGGGNVVVADTANQRIRRIDAVSGVITTIGGGAAGNSPGFGGDGGPATSAQLANPAGLAIDTGGNVLVADTANQRIRRIAGTTGKITTIAGGADEVSSGVVGDGGPATRARLSNPSGVAVDAGGNVVVADTANHRIRRIDRATGVITTLAGGAVEASPGGTGDGGPAAAAQLNGPTGVAVDTGGNVLVADTATQRIRRIDGTTGVITTLAGGADAVVAGSTTDPAAAPPGVAAPPSLASALGPRGVAVDRSGAAFIANTPRNRIDKAVVVAGAGGGPDAPGTPPDPGSLCQLVEGTKAPTSASPSWMTRTVSLSAASAEPGQGLVVQGNGFNSGQRLTVTLCSMPTVLGTITASPTGSYQTNVKLPASVAPGNHHLVLSDASGNAALALQVIQARAGAGAATDGGDSAGAGAENAGAADSSDPLAGDPSLSGADLGNTDLGADLGSTDLGTDLGAELNTDSSGMPTTGGEFIPMVFLAGAAIKLGGALVLASRRRSSAS